MHVIIDLVSTCIPVVLASVSLHNPTSITMLDSMVRLLDKAVLLTINLPVYGLSSHQNMLANPVLL